MERTAAAAPPVPDAVDPATAAAFARRDLPLTHAGQIRLVVGLLLLALPRLVLAAALFLLVAVLLAVVRARAGTAGLSVFARLTAYISIHTHMCMCVWM